MLVLTWSIPQEYCVGHVSFVHQTTSYEHLLRSNAVEDPEFFVQRLLLLEVAPQPERDRRQLADGSLSDGASPSSKDFDETTMAVMKDGWQYLLQVIY